ncbi:MAG: S9 family peptidase [Gemmatimonadetes bacterium]|nr:S9 family peptidase [Gemmatimonadota bacterium]
MFRLAFVALLAPLALTVVPAGRLAAQAKPIVEPKDYGRFETLGPARVSPDGRWIAYTVTRVDEKAELRIRRMDLDSTRTAAWGSDPTYSPDSRWLSWAVGMAPEERENLEKDKKPVRNGAGLLDLGAGAERSFPNTQARAFDATGRFLALHGYPPEEPKGKGADLRILDLSRGTELTVGNVSEFAWSDQGSLLAAAIATGADGGNGVQVLDAVTGRLQSLDASASVYRQLAWRKKAADLAALRSAGPASKPGSKYTLLAWRGLIGEPARLELDPGSLGVPDTLEVVEHRRPAWSDDGRRLAVGLRPVPDSTRTAAADSTTKADSAKTKPDSSAKKADDLAAMQIWHTADVYIIPQQKARAQATARRTLLAVWEPDARRLIHVGTDLAEDASVLDDWRTGTERVRAPYAWGTKFGRPYYDLWTVDLATGRRSRVLEKVRYSWESPGGRYLLSFDGKDYWSHDLRSGARANLTGTLPAAFADTAYDTPTDQLPPQGVGGWLDGDRAVFLYDEFDVWRVSPDGSGATRLTDGAGEKLVHRVVDLDRERDAFDPAAPLYLSLHGEWSEQRGYARILPGRSPERLLLVDRLLSGLAKADSANVLIYRAETRDDSPDWFAAGLDLRNPRQLSATNPFLADYAWTRMELIEFRNERDRPLQGVLLYPANHDPSRKYPMIVYTYEILSSGAHQFDVPSERRYYSFAAWTQAGYFVLLPDIVFRARDPGVSVLETLRPAVARVVAMGLVDSARVGLIGHSWGGYTATFIPTRTKLFAASVAGAPLTDFVSFMGQIHWTPGNAEADHWETGQARMEVPYWEDPEAHHRNSPIHKVQEMETPLLMAHGDKDGVVEFFQATEFYNFARRAGKQMVLLVYEGENHSFTRKANQIDYHRRILEWFGHYLKREPAPSWITAGVPLELQEREKRRVAGPQAPRAAAAGSR